MEEKRERERERGGRGGGEGRRDTGNPTQVFFNYFLIESRPQVKNRCAVNWEASSKATPASHLSHTCLTRVLPSP